MPISETTASNEDKVWLALAKDAFENSDKWFDASVRRQIEDAASAFNSQHPRGSKYHLKAFDRRSKLYRPFVRGSIRKLEAANAMAHFSTTDSVSLEAINKGDPDQVRAAQIKQALMRRRLNEQNAHWFETVMGAFQAAAKEKMVISLQRWEYEQDANGNVIRDRPVVDLWPVEQVRMDVACDWKDPANSSPYLIFLQPVYIYEILDRQTQIDPRTGKPWYREIPEEQLGMGRKHEWDSIRQRREDYRQDRYEPNSQATNVFNTVWIHHHIMLRNGQDYIYDTLGTELMLMDPVPIEEYYLHASTRNRPVAIGRAIIEAYRIYASSPADLLMPINSEINDLSNLALDSIRLNTTTRHYARRGGALDITTMLMNIPGSVIYMNDTADVRAEEQKRLPPDIWEERNRLVAEMSEQLGTWTGARAAERKQRTDTLGEVQLTNEQENTVLELTLHSFNETWMRPVLHQIERMITYYESDAKLMSEIGSGYEAGLAEVYEALLADTTVSVNVGFGNTNPQKRGEKLRIAMGTTAAVLGAEYVQQNVDPAEVVAETFGAAGYRDGARFFPNQRNQSDEDPRIAQLEQQLQEAMSYIESEKAKQEVQLQIAQIRADSSERIAQLRNQGQIDLFQMKQQFEEWKANAQQALDAFDRKLALAKEKREIQDLRNQREALSHSISMAEREFQVKLWQLFNAPAGEETSGKGRPGGAPAIEGEVQRGGDIGGAPNEFENVPSSSRELITGLRRPPSGEPVNLPGLDKAGVIARDDYGKIPFQGG